MSQRQLKLQSAGSHPPRWVWLALSLVLTTLLTLYLIQFSWSQSEWENPLTLFGTRDFVAFWAGYQAFRAGLDPYQTTNVLPFEQLVIPAQTIPQAYLNPPWALFLLAPVLTLDFPVARFLWIAINIAFLIYSVRTVRNWLDASIPVPSLVIGSALFFPLVMCLWMGQLSLFILFFLLLGFDLLRRKRYILSGLAFIPLTIKPQLVFILGIATAISLIRNRQWSVIFSFVIGFVTISLLVFTRYPELFHGWRAMDFSPLGLRSSSLATLIRESYLYTGREVPVWPVYTVPIVGGIISIVWFASTRKEITDLDVLVTSLCLSLGFAPYVWLYDYVNLSPIYFALFIFASEAYRAGRIDDSRRFACWLLLPVLMFLLTAMVTKHLQYFFWFPWVMLLGWKQSLQYYQTRSPKTRTSV